MIASRKPSEDVLMRKVVGKGSRRGTTWLGKAGDLVQQPPVRAGVAAVLSIGGPRGRRAALRGSACYLAAALVQILVNPSSAGAVLPAPAGCAPGR